MIISNSAIFAMVGDEAIETQGENTPEARVKRIFEVMDAVSLY